MSEYQIVKLDEVDDWLGDYPGEMRGITYAIGAEQVAITHRRMPQHTGQQGLVRPSPQDPGGDLLRPRGQAAVQARRRDRRGRAARGDPGAAADLARGVERRARGRRARDRLDADRRPDRRHREARELLARLTALPQDRASAWHRSRVPGTRSAPQVERRLVAPRHAAGCAPAGAAAERLDVRVAQNLDRGWITRPHRVPLSLHLKLLWPEYLDVKRLAVEPLDVKTFAVKMCA